LITEELLRKVYADNLLAEKAFETLTINVDTNVSDMEAKQITVQQLLIYGCDFDASGNQHELSGEEKAAAYEKVRNLWEQAKTTDDFYSLAEANSESDTIEYTFGRGQGPKEFSPSFEQAAFTLKTGQVSDIITTDYGWHIIYCKSDNNEDATIQRKEEIIDQRRSELFAKLYGEWTTNYDVVVNSEAWDAITYSD
jgi:foldase protein PrsA